MIMKILTIMILVTTLLAAAESGSLPGTKGGTAMTPKKRIPPIDAAAPARTETATFALG